MFENIRADLNRKRRAYGVRPEDQTFFRQWITPFLEFGTFAVLVYRFGRWAYSVKIPILRQLLIASWLLIDVVCVIVTGIKVHPESDIGPGLVVHTWSCIHVLESASDTVAQLTQGYRSQTSEVPAVPPSEIIVILALAARSWAVSQLVITWWSVRILWLLATCRVTAPYWACQLVSFQIGRAHV